MSETQETIPCAPYLTGEVILAGEIEIDHGTGESVPGVVIRIERTILRSVPRLPMYEPVVVLPISDFTRLTIDRDNWKIHAEEMDAYKADCMTLRARVKELEATLRKCRPETLMLHARTLDMEPTALTHEIDALLLAPHAAREAIPHA